MATCGYSMLTPEVEESVNAEARALENCDLRALLREQAEAVQHILAVSTALARRVHALDAQANRQYPTDLVSVPEKSRSDTTARRGLAEPLLAPFGGGFGWLGSQRPSQRPKETHRGTENPSIQKQSMLARGGDRNSKPGGESHCNSKPNAGIFPDVAVVQSFIKNCLRKDNYRVEDLYKTTGCSQRIAQDNNFRNLTFVVIFLNTVWIGYDTDHNHAEVLCNADLRFKIMENFFCTFFSFEVAVRFLAFKTKKHAFTDAWFVFDFLLVLLMVWETWVSVVIFLLMHDVHGAGGATSILRIFRLFRLTRVARLGRLISAVPELMLLVKGMLMALRSVGSTLMLMLVVVYVFSVLFTQLLKESSVGQGRFETVPMSINFLLVGSVFPDQKDDLGDMLEESVMYYLCMIVFLLLGSITVMNMLIGVLCEVVSIVAEAERREGREIALKTQLLEIMENVDQNQDMAVDMGELTRMISSNSEAVKLLDEAGVDVEAMVQNLDMVFQGNIKLPMDQFLSAVLRFRSDQTVSQKDLVDLQRSFDNRLDTLLFHIKLSDGE